MQMLNRFFALEHIEHFAGLSLRIFRIFGNNFLVVKIKKNSTRCSKECGTTRRHITPGCRAKKTFDSEVILRWSFVTQLGNQKQYFWVAKSVANSLGCKYKTFLLLEHSGVFQFVIENFSGKLRVFKKFCCCCQYFKKLHQAVKWVVSHNSPVVG